MALEMRTECERCQAPTAKEGEAYICTFECTFCADCSDEMDYVCPGPAAGAPSEPRCFRSGCQTRLRAAAP